MGWFGRKAAGTPRRPALVRGVSVGAIAGEWPRSYEAQVREAFVGNAVAQRAVRLVAEAVAEVPVYARPEHESAVALLRGGLLEMVAAQLLLHGNAFVQPVADADGVPAELFALRPERVTIEPDAGGWPAAYLYRAGEAATRLPATDGAGKPGLVHIKAMHPIDDHYGLGCLGAAAGAVAIHNAATRWNKALLDNAARPSGALVYEPGEPGATLSAEQFDRLRGRGGSGWATATHVAGERFVVIEPSSLREVTIPAAAIDSEVRVIAAGIGDIAGVSAAIVARGRALRPPAPVHVGADRMGDGTLRFDWIRRSRLGWAWRDGVDAPLGEETERYRLTISPDVGVPRTVEPAAPQYDYTAAEQAADGTGGAASVTVTIAQIGANGASLPPTTRTFAA